MFNFDSLVMCDQGT